MQGRDVAVLIGVVALIVLVLALFGGGMLMGPWMMGWGFYGFGGFWWWWIVVATFWVLIIAGVVWLIVWLTRQGRAAAGGPERPTPLDILRERYARGEITREEYERMRRDIEGG